MKGINARKADHINICLNDRIEPDYNYWNDVKLIHEALPEIDYDDIDTSSNVLGRRLDFPFMVTAITGGFDGAKKINANIAKACAELGIGMVHPVREKVRSYIYARDLTNRITEK